MKIALMTFPGLFNTFADGDDTNYHQVLEPSVLYIKPKNHDVVFLEENTPRNDIDLYICSVYTRGWIEFKQFANKVGKNKIIAGGYHPTALPNEAKKYAQKVVTGYCTNIDEILEADEGIYQGKFGFEEMDRSLLDMTKMNQVYPDITDDDITGSMVTSVGCPFACDFCSTPNMSGRKMQMSEFDYVESEIENLKRHGVTTVFIRDESFATHPRIKDIASLFKDKFRIVYSFGTLGVMSQKEEILKHLADVGWHSLNFGLEDIGIKYTKNKYIKKAVENCRKYGLKYNMSFIVNDYNKTKEELRANYKALYKAFIDYLPDQLNANFMMPLPGTQLWKQFHHLFNEKDFVNFDSKTSLFSTGEFAEWNKRMLVAVQLKYYYSDVYNKYVREFDCDDNMYKRMRELEKRFGLDDISFDKLLDI